MRDFYNNFAEAIDDTIIALINSGQMVDPGTWQGVKIEHELWEKLWIHFKVHVHDSVKLLKQDINPDLPWADDHFEERVGGVPSNPGITYKDWPHYHQDENWRSDSVFTHTYQERMWTPDLQGNRFKMGNLGDVVNLLRENMNTRQAFLPIWFPEDTGVAHGGRVPCSIGYHFLIRNGVLHCTYLIRSLDVVRHFRNDLYFASRLMLWMRDQLPYDLGIGYLDFSAISVHAFDSDLYNLKKKYR